MLRSCLRKLTGIWRKPGIRRPLPLRFMSGFEPLGERILPAISASFVPNLGLLSVVGDDLDNTVTISRAANGAILVNGGAVAIQGGTPTATTTALILVNTFGGNDTIKLDETNGALPGSVLVGGAGNDTLLGGSGLDVMLGGSGNDTIDGNRGNDLAFMGDGDDLFVWDPGDGSDIVEGEAGQDTMRFNGSAGNEVFVASANGSRLRFTRDLGNIVMDTDDVERVDLNALGGADQVTVNDLGATDVRLINIDLGVSGAGDTLADQVIVNGTHAADLIQVAAVNGGVQVTGLPAQVNIARSESAKDTLTVNGLAGDDAITGGTGLAALIQFTANGGDGNDVLNGGDGNDTLRGGAGNDTLIGNRGNDTMLGEAGNDLLIWNNGDGSDLMEGGEGTDIAQVNGAAAGDDFSIAPNGDRVWFRRNNLGQFSLDIGTSETLDVNGLGGDDVMNGSVGLANLIALDLDGGDGNDVLNGGDGIDRLLGGAGDDSIDGNRGNDVAFMGDGNDTFTWDPGDGSDVIEGQAGTDTMLFNGAAGNEIFVASANGGRLLFTRDLGNIVMDTDDVEAVTVNALGGVDRVTVNDLSATDVRLVNIDLGVSGAGDTQPDQVIVNGTHAADLIQVAAVNGGVQVTGLAAQVNITRSEAANDTLTVTALGGDDTVSAGNGLAALIKLALDGGDGNDVLNGGDGADTLLGGAGNDAIDGNRGNDVAFMGDGNDTFTWDPGDGSDVIEGQAGTDTMLFNGAAGNEIFVASANGARLRFTRDLGNIVMDTDDVEAVTVNALGGADRVTVNDLGATDVRFMNIDLGVSGAGDTQPDQLIVNGTAAADNIQVGAVNGGVQVSGLAAQVNIARSEAANDTLTVNSLGGDDRINASHLPKDLIRLALDAGAGADWVVGSQGDDVILGGAGNDTIDGGDGNDVISGDAGDDTLLGGDGNDVLLGGDGNDVLDGGAGIDFEIP